MSNDRTVTTLFTIPEGVTVWYPVWEDSALTYKSASSGEVALGMVGHPLSAGNIEDDGIVYVALDETTETKFNFTIKLIDADEDWQGVVYGEEELEIKVSEYEFEFEANIEIIAGNLLTESEYTSENGSKLGGLSVSDLIPTTVTLKTNTKHELGYEKVWIQKLEVPTFPEGGKLQAWMYDSEDGKWYDMVQTGWGSEDTGFKLDVNENKEMTVYVFADTPGTYGLTFKAVDINNSDEVITEGTASIFAPFHFNAGNGTISNYVGNCILRFASTTCPVNMNQSSGERGHPRAVFYLWHPRCTRRGDGLFQKERINHACQGRVSAAKRFILDKQSG